MARASEEGGSKLDTKFSKLTGADKGIMVFAYVILGLFMAAIILPVVYIILASFIDPITLQNHGLTFDFSKWTLTAYERVMTNAQIWTGFKNAMVYSVLFTLISVTVTLLAAYPMSRPDFKGKGLFNTLFVITMFFGGGLIPTYLLISNLGMLDTIWAVLIPGAFNVWNMIIARTYYMGIPGDMQEAAEIDGANIWQRIRFITLPSLKPTIMIMVLLALGNVFRGDFGMFYQLVGSNQLLLQSSDVIDTFVYRSLITTPNIGMSAAAGLYQSVLCFVTIVVANFIVKKLAPDYSLF